MTAGETKELGLVRRLATDVSRSVVPHDVRMPVRNAGKDAVDDSIDDLLAGLASSNPSATWRAFLQRYSAVVLHIVHRYESDTQRASECFDHVCQALSDDRFRRLRSFQPNGSATLRTWLMAVTANLCIDWRRKQRGRFRPIRAIAQLPELEQLVFRYMYVRGMRRSDCLRTLESRYPGLTEKQLSEINARLFVQLTPQQRWQAATRMAVSGPQADPMTLDLTDPSVPLEYAAPGPEDLAQTDQEHERLAAALARLPSQQRLLLRLRYEQGLTLAEVARLTGLHDPFRAHRQTQAALAALADLMDRPTDSTNRKTP